MAILGPGGTPVNPEPEAPPERQGVNWEGQKVAKTPPGVRKLPVPTWLPEIDEYIWALACNENRVMELVLERVVDSVEEIYLRGAVGIDLMPAEHGGAAPTRAHYVLAAAPIAVEVYKQVMAAIEKDREAFDKVVADALQKHKA